VVLAKRAGVDGAARGAGRVDGAARGAGRIDGVARGAGGVEGAARGAGMIVVAARGVEMGVSCGVVAARGAGNDARRGPGVGGNRVRLEEGVKIGG
jgi:hypothetical protein